MIKLKKMQEKTIKTKSAKSYNKGITLIALVITIVVLLILAGITINAVMSDGGIFNTAKKASKMQEEAMVKEKVQIMLADVQLQNLMNKTTLKQYLEENKTQNGIETITDNEDGIITIVVDGYEVTIDEENFTITHFGESDGVEDNTGGETEETSVPVTKVTLNASTAELAVEGTLTLTATIEPDNATNKSVKWSSNDENIAQVDENTGEVTAVAVGEATITAMATDGSGVSASCIVTVGEKIARIGTTYYSSIQSAINACPDNTQTTIYILKPATENITVEANKNIILIRESDFDPSTITINNYGTLTMDSCTISSSDTCILNYGTLTLDSCMITSSDTCISNRGTLALDSCVITSSSTSIWNIEGECNIMYGIIDGKIINASEMNIEISDIQNSSGGNGIENTGTCIVNECNIYSEVSNTSLGVLIINGEPVE